MKTKVDGVLVTGATTPIGVALVRDLLAHQVQRVLAVGVEPECAALPADSRLTYLPLDLTRWRNLRRLLLGPVRDLGIDAIVHTALHRRARDTGKRIHSLNVGVTRELLEMAESIPTIKRFVYRSFAEVYRLEHDQPNLIGEEHPLDLSPQAPQWVRDRVEGDLTVCTRMGMSRLQIIVLRCAEILSAECGSQLWDYLQSVVCFRPLGFDPMINLMTIEDVVRALRSALLCDESGIFNIPGADTLPVSKVILRAKRVGIAVPGPLLYPLYGMRRHTIATDFRYDLNYRRFHFSGIVDGTRARRVLGFEPQHPIDWADTVGESLAEQTLASLGRMIGS